MNLVRFALLCVIAGAAVPTGARAESKYCGNGTAAALLSADFKAAAAQIKQKCQPGDTVVLPMAATNLIASVCDFSRSVAALRTEVICQIGAVRELR